MKQSVQKRVVTLILIVGILSLLPGLVLVYVIGTATLKRTIGANFEELADVTAKKLDELITHHVEQAVFLAEVPDVIHTVERANARPPDAE
ncbi:MAG: hypothetical protein ABIO65_07330, partial [Nitrospiria bacterium]